MQYIYIYCFAPPPSKPLNSKVNMVLFQPHTRVGAHTRTHKQTHRHIHTNPLCLCLPLTDYLHSNYRLNQIFTWKVLCWPLSHSLTLISNNCFESRIDLIHNSRFQKQSFLDSVHMGDIDRIQFGPLKFRLWQILAWNIMIILTIKAKRGNKNNYR